MSVISYQPYDLSSQFQNEINRLFNTGKRSVTEWLPPVDVRETDEGYVLEADVPGVDPANIEITAEDGYLVIQGKREHASEQPGNGYSKIERPRGTFYRRFSLPDTAKAEAISATSRNGVLEIVIPKQERALARKIAVNVETPES